jgi:hypothetical protein
MRAKNVRRGRGIAGVTSIVQHEAPRGGPPRYHAAVAAKVTDRSARLCLRGLTGLLALSAMLVVGSADAADHAITAKKLLLKSSHFVLLSRDANAHTPGSPACPAADSSLTIADGVHTQTFILGCANWTDHSALSAYKDPTAASGPARVKIARNASGHLKVIGGGLTGIPVPNGPATINVLLDVGGTSERYCMTFSGTGNGNSFRVRDAAAASCPVCGNNIIEPGETCDSSADGDCHGLCQSDCTCPAPVCGNNVRESGEGCDGSDATACPSACLSTCACAGPCPSTPGDATACQAFASQPLCVACCEDDEECFICVQAGGSGCTDPVSNDNCTLAVTTVGCGQACCSAP